MSLKELSVVVPSVNGFDDLRDCLDALFRQEAAELEIIVVDRVGDELRRQVRAEFPDVVLVETGPEATIPDMRALAYPKATAPAVAQIEDHVIVPPGWARAMLDALDEGHDVVGGAVENAATETLIDWASFLCEYSSLLPPLPPGPSAGVPGNNVIYRRPLLAKYRHVIARGGWENRLHDAMRADGVDLIMRPEIVVGHKMHYTFWLYFTQRYHYSRSFAGDRVSGVGLPRRLAMGLAAFALPPILFYRTVSRVREKGQHVNELNRSLPLLAAFVVSWAAGEVVGYWFGPGRSLAKVR